MEYTWSNGFRIHMRNNVDSTTANLTSPTTQEARADICKEVELEEAWLAREPAARQTTEMNVTL